MDPLVGLNIRHTFERLPAVCGGVPEGRHVHQRQRPVQDQVCRRHVHGDADGPQPERGQPPPESPEQSSAERQEEQTARQLIAPL